MNRSRMRRKTDRLLIWQEDRSRRAMTLAATSKAAHRQGSLRANSRSRWRRSWTKRAKTSTGRSESFPGSKPFSRPYSNRLSLKRTRAIAGTWRICCSTMTTDLHQPRKERLPPRCSTPRLKNSYKD